MLRFCLTIVSNPTTSSATVKRSQHEVHRRAQPIEWEDGDVRQGSTAVDGIEQLIWGHARVRTQLPARASGDLRWELEALSGPSRTVTLVQMAARVSVPACEADPAGP